MKATTFVTGLLLTVISLSAFAAEERVLAPGEHWYSATMNHRHVDFTVLVYQPPTGEHWLRVLDLDQLGIPYAAERLRRHRAESYVLPDALIDHEVHLDRFMKRVHFVTHVRPHEPENTPADLLLDVRINGVLVDQPVYVMNTGSDLVLPRESLEQLRIALPKAYGPFLEDALPVHALAGERFSLELDRLYLEMTVPADSFETTRMMATRNWEPGEISDWSPSLVLGYNVAGGEDEFGQRWHSAVGDLAVSAGTFSCRSRHLAQSEVGATRRLDSACTLDWPDVPLSAGLGDHFTPFAPLQQSVAYGGFWIGTDYGLQPYRNLQPSLIVDGNARLPSTLEIWMDQRLGFRQQIPPGPFVVDNLPAVSGNGDLRAVLYDATGQEVIVSAPIFSDSRLLQPGIVDWRVEAGRLRPARFGSETVYTDKFGAASIRAGLTDWLTGNLHAEKTDAFAGWSANVTTRIWRLGLLETGLSESRLVPGGLRGRAELVGYTLRSDHLHASYREIRRDASYVSLGYPEPGEAPSLERTASVGASLGKAQITVNGVEYSFNDEERDRRLINATLALNFGRFGQLLLTAMNDYSSPDSEPQYGIYYSVPIGSRGNAYHSVSEQDGVRGSSSGFSLSPPPDSGFGLRLDRSAFAGEETYFAEAVYQGDMAVGTVSGQRHADGAQSWASRATGAVIASRAGIGLTRDEGDSFAMIETAPGVDNVGVLREHQVVTRTDNSGNAIVAGLRPYETNRLGLDVRDLPLSSDIDDDELAVVPGRRSVVVADYGFQRSRHLLARLEMPAGAGTSIPPGSQVTVNSVPAGLVGYDGTIYVALPDSEQLLINVTWPDGSCSATLASPAGSGVLDVGEVTCRPQ